MSDWPVAFYPPVDRSVQHPRSGAQVKPIAPNLLTIPVLIIEDEAMIAWMLESLCEDFGFEAITLAPSADAAMEAARHDPPGLIISDINLGAGLDGIEAATAIVGSGRTPVVFVTGYADDDARKRVAAALPGAAVLRKPIQPAELYRAIAAALRADGPTH